MEAPFPSFTVTLQVKTYCLVEDGAHVPAVQVPSSAQPLGRRISNSYNALSPVLITTKLQCDGRGSRVAARGYQASGKCEPQQHQDYSYILYYTNLTSTRLPVFPACSAPQEGVEAH